VRNLEGVTLRQETEQDRAAISEVHEQAFQRTHEAHIVEKVRQSSGFIPELSLVAEYAGQIIAHALFSKVQIENGTEVVEVLAFGPLAVRPALREHGIGSMLIREGIVRASELGYRAIVLIGRPHCYAEFGFVPGSHFGLKCSVPVPDEMFMIHPLRHDGLTNVNGTVVYPPTFAE